MRHFYSLASTKKAKEDRSPTSKYFEVDKNKVKSLFGTEPVKQVIGPPKPKVGFGIVTSARSALVTVSLAHPRFT